MRFAEGIDDWPWTKTVVLAGIFSYIVLQVISGSASLILLFFPTLQPDPAQAWLVDRMVRLHDSALDASLWTMGVGGAALVGKRAASKPEVIDAQARATVKILDANAARDAAAGTTAVPAGIAPLLATPAPQDELHEEGD